MIAKDKVASFHYTLSNVEGQELESSREGAPTSYLHGAAMIIPGLEKALEGRAPGDRFEVVLEPRQAYGERSEEKLRRIPSKHFDAPDRLYPGRVVMLRTQRGPVQVTVVKVGRFNVDVDANHPLAGQTLTFDIEVTDVRDATPEEISHGHVHGPGGVEHA